MNQENILNRFDPSNQRCPKCHGDALDDTSNGLRCAECDPFTLDDLHHERLWLLEKIEKLQTEIKCKTYQETNCWIN